MAKKAGSDILGWLVLIGIACGWLAFFGWQHHIAAALNPILPANLTFDIDAAMQAGWIFVLMVGQSGDPEQRKHVLSTMILSFLGAAGIVCVVACQPPLTEPLNIMSAVLVWTVGRTLGMAIMNRFGFDAWRGSRKRVGWVQWVFKPLGVLICLGVLVFELWRLDIRWQARDYAAGAQAACFAIGLISCFFCRKIVPTQPLPAAIA